MIKKEWLIIAILTFATIVAWVIFAIIHTSSQVETPQDLQTIIEPINPEFNLKGLMSTP